MPSKFWPRVRSAGFGYADDGRWREHVNEDWSSDTLVGPQTPYRADAELWTLPGEDGYERFDSLGRDLLAAAILDAVGDWPDDVWQFGFRRMSSHHSNKRDPQLWPSPVAAFVGRASWFPMADVGSRDDHYFVATANAWTFDEATDETAPRFAPLAPVDQRRRISDSHRTRDLLARHGVSTWNEAASARCRLSVMAALVERGDVPDSELLSLRRAVARAWHDLDAEHSDTTDLNVVVSRGARVDVIRPPGEGERTTVYVPDAQPGLVDKILEAADLPVVICDASSGELVVAVLSGQVGVSARRTSEVEASVVLDGSEVTPDNTVGEPFLEAFGEWLLELVLVAIELQPARFRRITESVLNDVASKLRRVRLLRGMHIELRVDGGEARSSPRFSRCVHLDDDVAPLIVLSDSTGAGAPSWLALEALADDLAEVLGQPEFTAELRAAAFALHQTVGEWRPPTESELAIVLRCDPERVTQVLAGLRSATDHLLSMLVPIVAVLKGTDAALELQASEPESIADLQVMTESILGEDATVLVAAAQRAETLADLRRALDVDLELLNEALAALGRSPLHFPQVHEAALRSYVSQKRDSILDRLRLQHMRAFDQRDPLDAYLACRDLRTIRPSPEWLPRYEEPPEERFAEVVEAWLSSTRNASAPRTSGGLLSTDETRRINAALAHEHLPRLRQLVSAWCLKRSIGRPDIWLSTSAVSDELDASGCLDFRVLDVQQFVQWVALLGLLPPEMPPTDQLSALGLTDQDLLAATEFETKADDAQRRQRTALQFGDRDFDTSGDELRELIDAVAQSATSKFLGTRTTVTKLSDMIVRAQVRKPPRSGGGKGRTYRGTRLTQEQTSAIGLAGETLAYAWLCEHYPDVTPDSWVSGYRVARLGGHEGDDTLGYDFEIQRKSDRLLFEVKATITDDFEFNMGESEVRAASAARKGSYRIIFIRSILEPEDRELLVLPNPFEPGHAAAYAQLNQGLALRFEPSAYSAQATS